MVALDLRHTAALLSAFALAAAVPLGRTLSRFTERRLNAAQSFAGGVSLAYVVLDLMVELAGVGGKEVHAALPIGPNTREIALRARPRGRTLWHVVAALTAQVGGHRARYLTYALPQAAYRAVVGGALVLEAEHGSTRLVFFALPMLLHLTVLESRIHREFRSDHAGVAPWILAVAPGWPPRRGLCSGSRRRRSSWPSRSSPEARSCRLSRPSCRGRTSFASGPFSPASASTRPDRRALGALIHLVRRSAAAVTGTESATPATRAYMTQQQTTPEKATLEALSPFQLKDELIRWARDFSQQKAATHQFLDAGRGNPNWVATTPREAFFTLGQFALQESKRVWDEPDLGGMPRARWHRRSSARVPHRRERRRGSPPRARARLRRGHAGVRRGPLRPRAVDGIVGDNYPVPDRMLVHAETVVQQYLGKSMYDGRPPAGKFDLFAVEGGTAAMCYVFGSLVANRVLKRGDTIALGTPIFTPYLEMPLLDEFGFKTVELAQSEMAADGRHTWQYPDAEIEKLADPKVKAFFVVNPSNPASVAMRPRTMQKIAELVRTKRPDLILLTDDVYGTFVDGFRSLAAELPHNTILVYSYSKYFGCTGWRLGVVSLHEHNVIDEAIARLPEADRQALHRRYHNMVVDPDGLKFIDRLVADSRDVALNHTAGLSLPQQVQMTLFSLFALLDENDAYLHRSREIIQRALPGAVRGAGGPDGRRPAARRLLRRPRSRGLGAQDFRRGVLPSTSASTTTRSTSCWRSRASAGRCCSTAAASRGRPGRRASRSRTSTGTSTSRSAATSEKSSSSPSINGSAQRRRSPPTAAAPTEERTAEERPMQSGRRGSWRSSARRPSSGSAALRSHRCKPPANHPLRQRLRGSPTSSCSRRAAPSRARAASRLRLKSRRVPDFAAD